MRRCSSPSHALSADVASAVQSLLDRRRKFCLQCRQFAQCWDLVEIGKVLRAILRRQELCPRSEKGQLIEGISTLPGEGAGPPPHLALGVGIESFDAGDHSAADVAS